MSVLNDANSVPDLLTKAVRLLVSECDAARVLILIEEPGEEPQKATYGLDSADVWNTQEINLTVLRKVLTYGVVIYSHDARVTVNYLKLEDRANILARSVLCAPLSRLAGKITGLIYMDHPDASKFDDSKRKRLIEVCSLIERHRPHLSRTRVEVEPQEAVDHRSRFSKMLDAKQLAEAQRPKRPSRPPCTVELNPRLAQLYIFQLSRIVDAGINIEKALEMMAKTDHHEFAEISERLASEIQMGAKLSEAIRNCPNAFDPVTSQLLEIGEETGGMVKLLNLICDRYNRRQKQTDELVGAFVYPVALLLTTLTLCALILYVLLPPFLTLIRSFDLPLPIITSVFISVFSHPLVKFGIPIASLLALNALVLYYKLGKLGPLLSWLKYETPIFGEISLQILWTDWCISLALLLQAGFGLVPALKLLAGSTGHRATDREIYDVAEELIAGYSFGEAMEAFTSAPNVIKQTIIVSDEIGRMSELIEYTAEVLSYEIESRISSLVQAIEPLLLGVLGLITGFVILCLFLPVIQLTAAIGN